MPDQHSSLAARQSRVCDNALAASVHLGVRFAPELCLELGKDTHVLSACVSQAVVALAMYRRSTEQYGAVRFLLGGASTEHHVGSGILQLPTWTTAGQVRGVYKLQTSMQRHGYPVP